MRAPAGAPPVAVAVVIPARDEEALLPAALASVRAAAGHPGVGATPVLTVVVADTCTDATAAVARAAGAQVVPVGFRNVGRSRAAGVLTALSFFGDVPGPVWIASTDADSTVRPDWLAHQLARAAEGWDAVVGTVTADRWPPGKPHLAARYHRLYETTRPPSGRPWHHPHVHGANLGVGSRAYTAAGGFPPAALDEDRGLVDALERTGARILRTADCPVTTSTRTTPRAQGGFGDHLANLERAVPPLAASSGEPVS
ncbi:MULTISPECIES: glycosyltransferase [Streptomyces]|uniref:4,4'-diaponeurosporenoate glycosyltransferase n=2 Tax=Streptomyces TaxID=1883 RepID=A0A1V0UMD7_STRVN|nr:MULTISPECIES: glycosyltransferase [Streptomyces]ARF66419.1 glycosyl transferase [Streptomyces violaceoruber]MBD3556220.1 glycosyltransferase [Streptomyces sp. SP18CM02]NEA13547.1 glycosyltransferase family 2 protein [Streptomyces sp. SID10692]KOG77710.1 glycosyl transferase [Streptomyces griseus subsp. rhodochrous]MBD3549146.1 glycosyltransferase [Streptomyces sp. JV180]